MSDRLTGADLASTSADPIVFEASRLKGQIGKNFSSNFGDVGVRGRLWPVSAADLVA
jgi:hypothetical protein